jgi:hypothetical protein
MDKHKTIIGHFPADCTRFPDGPPVGLPFGPEEGMLSLIRVGDRVRVDGDRGILTVMDFNGLAPSLKMKTPVQGWGFGKDKGPPIR